MAIELIVDDISKVDETFRGAYVEKDGKHYLDPDAYSEIKARPLKKDNFKLREERRSTKPIELENVELKEELRHLRLVEPVRKLAARSGIMEDRLDFALPDIAKRFSLDEGGELIVLDEHGEPTSMTPQKFFTIYRETHPFLFEASNRGGTGARSGTRGSGNSNTITREHLEKLSPQEAADHFKGGGKVID